MRIAPIMISKTAIQLNKTNAPDSFDFLTYIIPNSLIATKTIELM